MLQPDPQVLEDSRRRLFRWSKFAFQSAILCLVSWGLWHTLAQAQGRLAAEGVALQNLKFHWLSLAAMLYFLGMLPCAFFWHRVMGAIQQRVPTLDAITAFFVSQLGKYVPGKFMVIVLRMACVRRYQVNPTLAVASIFVETLTMMSVGAMLGAAMLALTVANNWRLALFAVVASAAVGAPTLPPIFLRLVKATRLHRHHPEIDQSLAGLNWHLLWPGWLSIATGWGAMGLSLWAVLQALPGVEAVPILPRDLPVLIACVGLSTVAGFVSGLPGGLGARELVVMQLMQPHFGATAAILAAVVHRCVMLATELLAAGALAAVSLARHGRGRSSSCRR